MTRRDDFSQAMDVFNLLGLDEKLAALREFSMLRFNSIEERFFEAVYRVITTKPKRRFLS
jgi:hypothetical protein